MVSGGSDVHSAVSRASSKLASARQTAIQAEKMSRELQVHFPLLLVHVRINYIICVPSLFATLLNLL